WPPPRGGGAAAWPVATRSLRVAGTATRKLRVATALTPKRGRGEKRPVAQALRRRRRVLAPASRTGYAVSAACTGDDRAPRTEGHHGGLHLRRHREDAGPLAAAAEPDRRRTGTGLPPGPGVRRGVGVHQALRRPAGRRLAGRLGRGRRHHRR